MQSIQTFNTKVGPKALGPYSTVKVHNKVLYLSGQTGIIPSTGELASEQVQGQARQIMDTIKAILGECKCEMSHILKCTIYLTTMADFGKVNAIYGEYFEKDPPARVAIAVAALPKNGKVEIDAIVAFPHETL